MHYQQQHTYSYSPSDCYKPRFYCTITGYPSKVHNPDHLGAKSAVIIVNKHLDAHINEQ